MGDLPDSSRWLPHGDRSSPPPPQPDHHISEVEHSGLLDGIEFLSDGGGGLLTPSQTPKRRRLLSMVAAGAVCAAVLIATLSVLLPSHGGAATAAASQSSDAAATQAAAPAANATAAVPAQHAPLPDREAAIRQWSRRKPGWALRMYDVPVLAVRHPPYSLKVRRHQRALTY